MSHEIIDALKLALTELESYEGLHGRQAYSVPCDSGFQYSNAIDVATKAINDHANTT